MFRFTQLGICLLAMTSAASHGQEVITDPPDPYVHKAVDVAFPAAVGSYVRTRVIEYDESGLDASAEYAAPDFGTPIWMTIYVYPSDNQSCEQNFLGASAHLAQTDGMISSENAQAIAPASFAGVEQYSSTYLVEPGALGVSHPQMETRLWIACPTDHEIYIKLRATYESESAEAARSIPQDLLDALDWEALTAEPVDQ